MREIEIKVGRNAAKEVGEWFDRPKDWNKEPREIIYVESISMLSTIFSPAKLRLLNELGKKKKASVSEIAKKLKRPRESVSRDLHLLEQKGLVGFKKRESDN